MRIITRYTLWQDIQVREKERKKNDLVEKLTIRLCIITVVCTFVQDGNNILMLSHTPEPWCEVKPAFLLDVFAALMLVLTMHSMCSIEKATYIAYSQMNIYLYL